MRYGFIAGVVDECRSLGIPEDRAIGLFKRAMEHPEVEQMFKELPVSDLKEHEPSPEDLAIMQQIQEQVKAEQDMVKAKMQLQQLAQTAAV